MAPPLITGQYHGAEMKKLAKARRALQVFSVNVLLTFILSKIVLLIAINNLWIPLRFVAIPLFLQDKLVYILIFKKLFEY